MDNFYIYGHYKPDSMTPFYVGKGCKNRAFVKPGRNRLWEHVVKKHGYRIEIMYNDLSEELAFQLERDFIKMWGRIDLGTGILVNMTDGGEGGGFGRKMTAETRKKMSVSKVGKKREPFSEEHKQKLRESGRKRFENAVKKERVYCSKKIIHPLIIRQIIFLNAILGEGI